MVLADGNFSIQCDQENDMIKRYCQAKDVKVRTNDTFHQDDTQLLLSIDAERGMFGFT